MTPNAANVAFVCYVASADAAFLNPLPVQAATQHQPLIGARLQR